VRIYFCSGTAKADELNSYVPAFERRGHEVVSRWHSMDQPRLELSDPEIKNRARLDLIDIMAADAVVAFSGGKTNRGGRHFEVGFAYGLKIPFYLIGEVEHAFHTLAAKRFETLTDFLEWTEKSW
jgi:nucleoside 2-deoxyribosyltransferase